MPLPAWALALVTGGFSLVKDGVTNWMQHRQKMKELKRQRKQAIVEAEIRWNEQQVIASGTSWKDEYWTIILSIPLILCFIPELAPYVLDGFEVLKETPDWYKAAVGIAIAAAFGYRKYADWTMRKQAKDGNNE